MLVSLRHTEHKLRQRVMYRGMEEPPDWTVSVHIDRQMASELSYVKTHIAEYNGHPIPSNKTVHVFNINGTTFCQNEPWLNKSRDYQVFASDASEKVAFVYEAQTFSVVEEYGFTEQEQTMSSGARELKAVMRAISDKADYFKKNPGRVYWITDSKNVFYFLKRGSRKSHIQQEVMIIKKLEKNYGIQIIPIWQPRESIHIVLADLGSKAYQSTDEWSMGLRTFQKIQRTLGITATVDCFATRVNALCPKFYSKYPQIGAAGINFYAQKLSRQERYWICPPVPQVVNAIKHVLNSEERIIAYVTFPEWISANYWPFVTMGERFAPCVSAVFYSRPKFECFNEASNVFRGYQRFRMITVLINNKSNDNRIHR